MFLFSSNLFFTSGGVVINGIQEQALRDHWVMNGARLDSNEKLKQEVFDIARAKSAFGQQPYGS